MVKGFFFGIIIVYDLNQPNHKSTRNTDNAYFFKTLFFCGGAWIRLDVLEEDDYADDYDENECKLKEKK